MITHNLYTVQELREMLGISRIDFSKKYHIPLRTLESWEWGERNTSLWGLELLNRIILADIEKEKNNEKTV